MEDNFITLRTSTQLSVPARLRVLGVVGDSNARSLTFRFPRWPAKQFDLSTAEIFITYENSDGSAKAKDWIEPKNITVSEDEVEFYWLPLDPVFLASGIIKLKVSAIVKENTEIKQSWQTETAILKVASTLPDYDINSDQSEDICFISTSDYLSQEEADAIVEKVYTSAASEVS
jgi:hypothetical protein